jgi:chromosome partitioning protein
MGGTVLAAMRVSALLPASTSGSGPRGQIANSTAPLPQCRGLLAPAAAVAFKTDIELVQIAAADVAEAVKVRDRFREAAVVSRAVFEMFEEAESRADDRDHSGCAGRAGEPVDESDTSPGIRRRGYLRESALIVYTLNPQPLHGVTMILAVGNIKGGVGKTMLAVNIAVALAQQGRDVLLIDGDDQASAATFARIRADLPANTGFTTIQLQGAAIRQQMLHLAGKYDRIIVDVGGRDSGSLRAALTVADAILIPFQPRSVDLWTAGAMGALIREARYVNERLRAYALLNLADPQGELSGRLGDEVDQAAW